MQHRKRKRNIPTREEALALFKELRPTYGVLQTEIAAGTGMNQGSVSKILGGSFKKLEGRAYKVWKYASQEAAKRGYKPSRQPAGKPDARLTEKIAQVWDRTEAGTRALLKLLEAADLMQKRRRV